jgi:hypothetical protein
MEDVQNSLNQEDGTDSNDVVNGGVGVGDAEEQGAPEQDQGYAEKDDPYGVKKRLGMQAKKHQREMRQMQEQMMRMQSQMANRQPYEEESHANAYPSPGQPNPPNMSEEQKIQMAVRYALGAKEHEEKQAEEARRKAHVQKQYARLNDELDKASEKYDDFDEVVRGDAPFTQHVRDALLLVDNPGEVAYRLGKNRDELERISRLHPLDQAREVNKLSFALLGGNSGKTTSQTKVNPMGSIKANPANSNAVTDKTPPSVIRARMKAGTWK